MNSRNLPSDCVLLPLSEGVLLVSREHATFCRVPPHQVSAVQQLVDQGMSEDIEPSLLHELGRHGFFGLPRDSAPASPSVQLQLTNACNLDCTYCCTNSGRARQGELTREEVEAVLRAIPELVAPGTRVAILGGEPFLVPWTADVAELAVDLGLELTIFTNGVLLARPELAQRVAALMKRGAKVRISLAGPTHELCDRESGAPRYDGALEGVQQLFDHGGVPTVDLMLTPQQVADTAAELFSLRQQLPKGVPISLGVLYWSGREQGQHLFTSRSELEQALDRIAFEAGERIGATPPAPTAQRREGCGCAMGHHLHLRSDGALFSCFKMEEKVGHLRQEGFASALSALRDHPHPATSLSTCADCPLNTICGGGCRSENLLYTGDPDVVPCGEWRVRVVSELLADDRPDAMEWPVPHLLAECKARGIEAPDLMPARLSRHLLET